MAIHDMLLPEFDQEMASTRKMLSAVPEDHLLFQPHAKSWKLNRLAGHIAELPGWITHTMKVELLELSPSDYHPFEPASRAELLDKFDRNVSDARAALATATDEQFNVLWTMKWDGNVVMSQPRIGVIRSVVLNHLIHHRAQLGMYLRLANQTVPGMYGPSADENPFTTSKEKAA